MAERKKNTAAAEEAPVEVRQSGDSGGTECTPSGEFTKLPNPCVYCGPSVRGVARQYTTYQGGIPDALREFVKEHPEALGLIVSTGQFPAMRRRLETPGTAEAMAYRKIKEELRAGGYGRAV